MNESDKVSEIMFSKLADGLDSTSRLTRALLTEIRESEADFATIKTELTILRENVKSLSVIVKEGNGQTSLLTKIALIEQKLGTLDKGIESIVSNHQNTKDTLSNLKSDFDDLERRFRQLERQVNAYLEKADEKDRMERDEMRVSLVRSKELEDLEKKNMVEIKKEKTVTALKIIGVVVATIISAVYALLHLK